MIHLFNQFQRYRFSSKKYFNKYITNTYRLIYYKTLGANIMPSSCIPKMTVNWPHQLEIGKECTLEDDLNFKYDGIWQEGPNIVIGNNVFIGTQCEFNICKMIKIGDNTLIASGCKFIDHNHGYSERNTLYRLQKVDSSPIIISSNVWIGVNTIILAGVKIGHNAIIGAGSVVTKSIPSNEIWAGTPAKKIKKINLEN